MCGHLVYSEVRLKMGLSEEAATKVIKGVQNQRLIGNLQAAKSQGVLTLEKVLDMADSGVDVDSFISADMRLQMFSKEVRPSLTPHGPDLSRCLAHNLADSVLHDWMQGTACVPSRQRMCAQPCIQQIRDPAKVTLQSLPGNCSWQGVACGCYVK